MLSKTLCLMQVYSNSKLYLYVAAIEFTHMRVDKSDWNWAKTAPALHSLTQILSLFPLQTQLLEAKQ